RGGFPGAGGVPGMPGMPNFNAGGDAGDLAAGGGGGAFQGMGVPGGIDPNAQLEEELDLSAVYVEVYVESPRIEAWKELPQALKIHHRWGMSAVEPLNLKDDPAAAWSDKLGDFRIKRTEHYLLRCDQSNKAEVVQNYEKLLESNYRAFFSWLALKGKYVPTPDVRLVAVLSEKAEDFGS